MLYFKNSELAYTYHVSVRTVRNWIEAAKQGKLDLDLHSQGNKTYVSNTSRNLSTIEQLVERGKKYRPHRAVKTVTPKPEFYQLFNESQVYDIMRNLEVYCEIPRDYNYFDGGAHDWDKYVQRFATEDTLNSLTGTLRLLKDNKTYIESLTANYDQINIVDIGVGNAYPVKDLLADFISRGKLGRYIALDISPDILKIARRNIKKWFGDKINYEEYLVDIKYDRFSDLLAEEYIKKDQEKTLNLVLLFGGTLNNLRDPNGAFRIIHDSLGVNDLLLYVQKLDSEASRKYFDFNIEPGQTKLAPIHKVVADLLNIDESFYDIEVGYDPERRERYERIRLDSALTIRFDFETGQRTINFDKGQAILVWRAKQSGATELINQFDRNSLSVIHSSQTLDEEYILTISRIKRD